MENKENIEQNDFKHFLEEMTLRGNHSAKDKLRRKKLNIAKQRKKCSNNMTPSVTWKGNTPIVKCTPINRKKSRLMKKVKKKFSRNKSLMRRAQAKRKDTMKFRYGKK